ncbi:oligosaccharide repeat unit polymerase [Edaphobacter bradus]|uniref:oligosaccharide repeat unit polymerase n=1 Tax=Edaphobacter bradus TaxID=2259016 RepID=UPI0021E017E0|nr:oligosaccharide repeat unit polymerase [Edaphobacter bradus]
MTWNILYVIDFLAISLFAISYYRNCYRRGYRIDFWHAQLFLICVFPNLLLLPFAKSDLNELVLGRDFAAVLAVLPIVFLLTLLGFFAMLAGGIFWRLRAGLGARKTTIQVLDIVPRCSLMLMSSRGILVFQTLLCLLLQMLILSIYFSQSGFAFNLREYTFANPTLRPVALFISNYSVIIASHCLARYIDTKERVLLACTLLLTVGMIFFGARSNIAAIYINVLMCYLVALRSKISLVRLTSMISAVIVAGLYLGSVRGGQYSLSMFFGVLVLAIFFGNNFSDLRDFAWVYSTWNHKFWVGKTYFAALTAFVPRFASQFRDNWGLGAATATTLGLDPHSHPGVRPGYFGEGFFNFGVVGVVGIGLALGIVIRRVDMDVKGALASSRPSMMKAFASTMLIGVAGACAISSGFSGLYVLGGIYLFSWFCLRIQRMIQPRSSHLRTQVS